MRKRIICLFYKTHWHRSFLFLNTISVIVFHKRPHKQSLLVPWASDTSAGARDRDSRESSWSLRRARAACARRPRTSFPSSVFPLLDFGSCVGVAAGGLERVARPPCVFQAWESQQRHRYWSGRCDPRCMCRSGDPRGTAARTVCTIWNLARSRWPRPRLHAPRALAEPHRVAAGLSAVRVKMWE